jgi:hypothetical protein
MAWMMISAFLRIRVKLKGRGSPPAPAVMFACGKGNYAERRTDSSTLLWTRQGHCRELLMAPIRFIIPNGWGGSEAGEIS